MAHIEKKKLSEEQIRSTGMEGSLVRKQGSYMIQTHAEVSSSVVGEKMGEKMGEKGARREGGDAIRQG